MRGFHVAGVGLAVASGAMAGEPAARFGDLAPAVVARGQAPAAPPAGSNILTPPRPVPQGPTVTEQRGNGTTPPTTVAPPPVVFGTPVPYGTYHNLPPTTTAGPPSVGPVTVPQNIEPPLVGPGGTTNASGPFGILTGAGQGFAGPQRLRFDADFLLWWVRGGGSPTLLTTAQLDGRNLPVPGTTQTLYGGDGFNRTMHTGARFGGTYWLDECSRWGVDGSVFFLARRGFNESFTSDQNPVLLRPFFNANQGTPFAEIVAAPGLASGGVVVRGETTVWGADATVRRHLLGGCDYRLDGFLGFRYLSFDESLEVNEQVTRLPTAPANFGIPGASSAAVIDKFKTENNFYGVNVGLAGEMRRGRWFGELRTSVALGTVFQKVSAEGVQLVSFPAGVAAYQGGLLALPGNIGTTGKQRFGVVPEVGLKLGCHVTDRWRVNVGYNFLYLNSVLRPGDQIDTNLDITKIPNFPQPNGTAIPALSSQRPTVPLRDSGVFVQGISFGLQWSF